MSHLALRANADSALAAVPIVAPGGTEFGGVAPAMSTPATVLVGAQLAVVAIGAFAAGYALAGGTGPHPQ
ncbi:hypothetical protein ACFW1A_26575 [Kitasatospora sp. NPDC058965]|uniref:hypothetical protein n=1 Tax=Kitasatospora sp. NPDC058965 TaxID=3346682 RepID=UPI0036CC3526